MDRMASRATRQALPWETTDVHHQGIENGVQLLGRLFSFSACF